MAFGVCEDRENLVGIVAGSCLYSAFKSIGATLNFGSPDYAANISENTGGYFNMTHNNIDTCNYPPEDSDNGEELERVGVVDVRGHLLQEQVDVEAQRRHVVDYVYAASQVECE